MVLRLGGLSHSHALNQSASNHNPWLERRGTDWGFHEPELLHEKYPVHTSQGGSTWLPAGVHIPFLKPRGASWKTLISCREYTALPVYVTRTRPLILKTAVQSYCSFVWATQRSNMEDKQPPRPNRQPTRILITNVITISHDDVILDE